MQFLTAFITALTGILGLIGSLFLCIWVSCYITRGRSDRAQLIAILINLAIWASLFIAIGTTTRSNISKENDDACVCRDRES